MIDEPGVRFGVATGAELAIVTVAGVVGLTALPTGVALVAITAYVGRALSVPVVAALGLIAWAFFTGFVENAAGALTFTGPDLARLAMIVIAVLLATRAVPRASGAD